MSPYLEMRGITKAFPGVLACGDIDFTVERGEVHTLLGENGAGKTTLMKCLYGEYVFDEGEVLLRGKPLRIENPRDAIVSGIGMVHQHFMLIPALSVTENVVLGLEGNPFVLDYQKAADDICHLAEKFEMHIDPRKKVEDLSVGQCQRLEILKALYRGCELLILDEPTAVLTPQEVVGLFSMIRLLKKEHHSVVFISHKMNEVMEISDRISVLRQGRMVKTVDVGETDAATLARLMVGHDMQGIGTKTSCNDSGTLLQLKNVSSIGKHKLPVIDSINLTLCKGEILGIAGVDGNGQDELIDAITGLRKVSSGTVLLKDRDVTNARPSEILDMKVSHIPADRHKRAMILDMNLVENTMLMNYHRPSFSKRGLMNWRKAADYTEIMADEFNVKRNTTRDLGRMLSGGNQQKLVLGRELDKNPDVLIAMHPVRGLDVGATEYIRQKIIAKRNEGCAVLLVSTELDEILEMSDRIAVMYEGRIMKIVDASSTSREEIGLLMAGKVPA